MINNWLVKYLFGRILFLIVLLFSSVTALAQGDDDFGATASSPDRIMSNFNSISPNIASLGVFGNIPVSNYTGHPEIGVPLFNMKNGGLSIDVGLNYNVSMVKPDVHPGWTGLGWGLNIAGGGVITRKRNDMPDEGNRNFFDISNGYLGKTYASGGFYYFAESRAAVQNDNWENLKPESAISSQRDTEPDEFSFKFMGYSGKFFLDHNGKWQVRSDQPIKVEFDGGYLLPPFPVPRLKEASSNYFSSTLCYLSTIQVFKGFTLTDDSGIKYVFGGSNDAIEYNINYTDQHLDDWVAGAWFLTKIILPNEQEVNLTYERGQMILDLQVSASYSLRTASVNGYPTCGMRPPSLPVSGQVISPVYPSSVVTSWGQALRFYSSETNERYYPGHSRIFRELKDYFYTGAIQYTTFSGNVADNSPRQTSWRKLDSISLTSNSKRLKSFKFLYNQTLGGYKDRRLMLLQVVPVSEAGAEDSPYNFKYSSTFDGEDYFTDYLSEKSDHWGYFSNKSSDYITLMETPDIYYQSRNGTDDLNILHSNLLTKIIYPTKGSSVFKYERGQYQSTLDSTRQKLINHPTHQYGGGPRIREIVDSDENGQAVKRKTFLYVKGYVPGLDPSTLVSSGILSGIPKYNYHYKEVYDTKYEHTNGAQDHIEVNYNLNTTNPILPLNDEFFYNPVGYSEVVELEESLKTGYFENGYTIFKYTGFEDGHFDDPAKQLYPEFYPQYPVSSRAFERGRLKSKEVYDKNGYLLESRKISWGNREIDEMNPRDQYARAYRIRMVKLCAFSTPIGGGAQFTSFEKGAYRLYYYPFRPLKEELTKYTNPGEAPLVTTTTYKYNDFKLLSEKMVDGSGMEQLITRYHYPLDVVGGPVWAKSLLDGTFPSMSSAISFPYSSMVVKHNIGVPVEVIDLVKRNGTEQIRGVKLTKYKGIVVGGSGKELAVPATYYRLTSAVSLGTYRPHTIDYEQGKEVNLELNGGLTAVTSYLDYDQKGNLLSEKNANLPGSVTGSVRYLWGYQQNFQVGEVSGAQFGEVGYTSFEDGGETWKGFLDRRGLIINATAPTGNVAYGVSLGLSKTALDPASRYTFTYWYSDGSVVNVTGASSPEVIRSYNGWTQVRQEISGVNEFRMSGNSLIDELRFYPAGAKMVTCTYLPGIGISSKTDEKGKITYYEYDEFQRLKLVRDQNGYILNSYTYHFKP